MEGNEKRFMMETVRQVNAKCVCVCTRVRIDIWTCDFNSVGERCFFYNHLVLFNSLDGTRLG